MKQDLIREEGGDESWIFSIGSRSGTQKMSAQFDAGLSAAILSFNAEAVLYYQGISDMVAQEYARNYARMLLNRAKGTEFSLPRSPFGLFEPHRNLIQSTLDRMWEKHLSAK